MNRYVIDSYAMITFFENESGADLVAGILKQIIHKKARGFMSIINWGEIYYSTMREQGKDQAEAVIRQIAKYPIELVDADKDITYEAARLKGTFKIAYADCFAAALAIKLKAKLVTGDPEFKQLQDRLDLVTVC